MSLPLQICSTELPTKYRRRHDHLNSPTDHHDNESLEPQQQKDFKMSMYSTAMMFK
jgi:hypothetical protein